MTIIIRPHLCILNIIIILWHFSFNDLDKEFWKFEKLFTCNTIYSIKGGDYLVDANTAINPRTNLKFRKKFKFYRSRILKFTQINQKKNIKERSLFTPPLKKTPNKMSNTSEVTTATPQHISNNEKNDIVVQDQVRSVSYIKYKSKTFHALCSLAREFRITSIHNNKTYKNHR